MYVALSYTPPHSLRLSHILVHLSLSLGSDQKKKVHFVLLIPTISLLLSLSCSFSSQDPILPTLRSNVALPQQSTVLILLCVCLHTTICVLILLFMCPHTTVYVSSYYCIRVRILLYMCPHTNTCVLILLHMCPHTTPHASSSYYMCPHPTTCVLILLHMCPHPTAYVSSYYQVKIAVAGGIDAVVAAMVEHTVSEGVQEQALRCLINLTVNNAGAL